MLKIWKQSWKKEDSAGQDSGQDTQSRGPDDDKDLTPSHSFAAPPVLEHDPNGPVSSRALPAVALGSRNSRPRDVLDSAEDELESERPSKRRRTDPPHEESISDALSKHLPEVMDVDEEQIVVDPNTSQSRFDNIITEAKQGNTLAYFNTETQKVTVFCDLLTWACGVERDRPNIGIARRRRAALLVVDDMTAATVRASQFSEVTNLSLGVYTPAFHSSGMNHWLKLVYKDVIIVSADYFLESLSTGSLAISQIHYMIVDDIFSLKDNTGHPVTKVMREYYRITDKLSRPKLFGALVVPSDAHFVLDISLLKLEEILDAQFNGVSNEMRESFTTLPDKPTELVVYYDPQVKLVETPLQKRLRSHDPGMVLYRKYHRNAKLALAEIGPCACDLVWRRALRDIEAELENDEPVYEEEDELQAGSDIAVRKAKSNIRDTIKDWLFAMPNLDPSSRGFNVTPKFSKLIQILKACEPQEDAFRGVIFVHKRHIAYIITDLLRTLDDHVGFLRPQALAGHGPTAESATQSDILDGFRTGLYNLLVVTKYAEDLEIAKATIVIRFDMFDSQVSYALCRCRARGQDCHLVHMAERGSDVHRRILSRIATHDARFENWVQRMVKNPGSAIPPLPLRETNDPYRSDSDDEDDDSSNFIMDPTTSGKIYLQDAITVLYRFVSQLKSQNNQDVMEPLFEYEELQGRSFGASSFICTVLLPPTSLVTRVSGSPCSSLAHARRSACYQTCVELFNRGILDYRLFPRPSLPSSRPQRPTYISMQTVEQLSDKDDDDNELPVKSKQGHSKSTGARAYPRKYPDFWRTSQTIMRGCLYPTVITPLVDPAEVLEAGGPYSPMLLLTRLPLPPLLAFNVFFSGSSGKVSLTRAASFEVDDEQLQDLCKYTIRVIRYITNKPFICSMEEMAYFFAPLPLSLGSTYAQERPADANQGQLPTVGDLIPWDSVRLAGGRSTVALKSQDLRTLTEDTEDAIIQDRWVEFTRRYYCVRMRPDLTPLSKPEDSLREKEYANLAEYCKARRKGYEGLQNFKQPLIEVQRCPPIINNLNPASKPLPPGDNDTRYPAKYLIPELCAKCTLPASIYRTATLIPSIMQRIDDLLLIKELNAKFFDHEVSEQYLHEAVSAPSSAIEYDYERLELLGDAYLKYLSSIYLFVTFPSTHEGALHILRQRIISNKSLLRNANRCGLPPYIQSKPFTLKIWSPPGFHIYRPQKLRERDSQAELEDQAQALEDGELAGDDKALKVNEGLKGLEGSAITDDGSEQKPSGSASVEVPAKKMGKKKRQENESNVQWLGDKGVADVAEAIIGAAYITGGREVALKVTKALNIPVPHIDRWTDFGRKVLAPPPEVTAKLRCGSIEAVEEIIGHKFDHKHLLAQALTHASIHGNDMTSYERLEFIGDAILDFLVIRHIYDRDNGLSPGDLTLLKSAMVSNSALAAVCVWAGLHEHLLFESYALADNIKQYANKLKAKELEETNLARKEERSPGQYWADIEPPKALSDVVESILGAVYVSDNFSPVGAETVFDKVLKPFYDRHITLQTISHHPTKILFEHFQSQGCQKFEIVKSSFPPNANDHTAECQVVVHDIILTSATDVSSNSAARRASFLALDAIEGDPGFLLRTCDCREIIQARKAAKKANKKPLRNAEEVEEQIVENVLASD